MYVYRNTTVYLFGSNIFVLANYIPVLIHKLTYSYGCNYSVRTILDSAFFLQLCFEITFKS